MTDLSVIIPARNEEFLKRTIDEVLQKAEGDTEVIAILDGYWPTAGIPIHKRVTLIHHTESIGQRAATNEGVKLSQAKFVMKLDAHCALSQGFDVKLMADCEYNWTVIPRMFVLDAFHWVCKGCGREHPQGPVIEVCDRCKGKEFEKKIVWDIKKRKKTDYMWFDKELRIKYFDSVGLKPYGGDINQLKEKYSHKVRDWTKSQITDVMCGIGACWLQHRDYYLELGGLDEDHGSWGQVAVEVACKTWLSGGRHVVNKRAWFAHLPRTQKGFSWPYPNPASAQVKARKHSKGMWLKNKWKGQNRDLSWLVNKFGPLPGWEETPKELTKGLVYYCDNQCEERITETVRRQLESINLPIVSVSHYPINFGKNILVPLERSALTMFKQILAGLETSDEDIVFLVEADMIYHPYHFDFIPPRKDTFYYNENTWKVCSKTGQALFYHTKQVSGLCAYRELLLEHYRKRVARVEKEGFTRKMGFEPGCHKPPRGIDDYEAKACFSEHPNVDIRHSNNFTANRWKKNQFRDQNSILGWTMADEVPFWGKTKGRFDDFLREVTSNALQNSGACTSKTDDRREVQRTPLYLPDVKGHLLRDGERINQAEVSDSDGNGESNARQTQKV